MRSPAFFDISQRYFDAIRIPLSWIVWHPAELPTACGGTLEELKSNGRAKLTSIRCATIGNHTVEVEAVSRHRATVSGVAALREPQVEAPIRWSRATASSPFAQGACNTENQVRS
jgi:hypothetical protein